MLRFKSLLPLAIALLSAQPVLADETAQKFGYEGSVSRPLRAITKMKIDVAIADAMLSGNVALPARMLQAFPQNPDIVFDVTSLTHSGNRRIEGIGELDRLTHGPVHFRLLKGKDWSLLNKRVRYESKIRYSLYVNLNPNGTRATPARSDLLIGYGNCDGTFCVPVKMSFSKMHNDDGACHDRTRATTTTFKKKGDTWKLAGIYRSHKRKLYCANGCSKGLERGLVATGRAAYREPADRPEWPAGSAVGAVALGVCGNGQDLVGDYGSFISASAALEKFAQLCPENSMLRFLPTGGFFGREEFYSGKFSFSFDEGAPAESSLVGDIIAITPILSSCEVLQGGVMPSQPIEGSGSSLSTLQIVNGGPNIDFAVCEPQ